MNLHAPDNYECPICLGIKGIESDKTMLRKQDLIYKTSTISVFINSFFITGNEGHVIIVPNDHYENLYDLPADIAHDIIDASKKLARVVKDAYLADGITIQQNNEPAGGQHAFHFHMHVFPRFEGDTFYDAITNKRATDIRERAKYIDKLKVALDKNV